MVRTIVPQRPKSYSDKIMLAGKDYGGILSRWRRGEPGCNYWMGDPSRTGDTIIIAHSVTFGKDRIASARNWCKCPPQQPQQRGALAPLLHGPASQPLLHGENAGLGTCEWRMVAGCCHWMSPWAESCSVDTAKGRTKRTEEKNSTRHFPFETNFWESWQPESASGAPRTLIPPLPND